MDAKSVGAVTVTHLSGNALETAVDLFAFTAFGDPSKDAVWKAVDTALGGVLVDSAKAESFEGKAGPTLSLHTHGKIAPRPLLVIGAGAPADFANPAIPDPSA